MASILNFVQVTERIATSGQPTREQFSFIAQSGYRAVINLAMPDSTDAFADEGAIVTSHGMAYFHIPVPFDAPQSSHLSLFLQIMQALAGGKVWVHCAKNYRVSAFMQHYLIRIEGLTREDAQRRVFSQWQPDDAWQRFLQLELRNC